MTTPTDPSATNPSAATNRVTALIRFVHSSFVATFSIYTCLIYSLFMPAAHAEPATATFAGGCFWCVEAAYQDQPGVLDAVSGFTGGTLENPTYDGNHKGHYESVKITYDAEVITYRQLLDIFWRNVDPFDASGQFCDKGSSYLSAIFYDSDNQKALATASSERVAAQFPDQQLVTKLLPAGKFWPVEASHQDYYMKNPFRYRFYRHSCGRDARLKAIWGETPSGH